MTLNFIFGTMNKLIYATVIMLALAACGNDSSKSLDEQERPADWKANFELVVTLDSTDDDLIDLHVVSSKQSQSLSELIDQVYDLSFSGDADVFGSTLFGEIDLENKLEPKSLLESLEFYDTVYVEDLITGETKDTVVDLSFNKSAITAFTILFSISEDQSIVFSPTVLSIGKQKFNEQTGEYRGYSDKFFVAVNDGPESSNENLDKMIVLSDSLGQFHVSSFRIYYEDTKQGLGETISKLYGDHDLFDMKFSLEFDYSQSKLTFKNVVISPIENPNII